MGQIEVFSPAKINLFLAVTGKLDTGYHELVSLVAPLDFGDQVSVSSEAGDRLVTLECDDPSLPSDEGNLAFAAAEAFLERYGLQRSVKIDLRKRIPHGAGLGGGSSNASAVLEGLARLEGVAIDEELEGLASELGSDCPLFLRRAPLIMRGRGERLEGLSGRSHSSLSGLRVLLFRPSVSISTAWAFGRFEKGGAVFADIQWAENRLAAWVKGDLCLRELLFNSFESVVFYKFPAFRIIHKLLKDRGVATLMSGSGSCFFALCNSDQLEREVRRIVRSQLGEGSFLESAILL